MLKLSFKNISKPLKTIVSTKKYLFEWKTTKIIAISKKSEFFLPSIYRLISFISCVGEIYGKNCLQTCL